MLTWSHAVQARRTAGGVSTYRVKGAGDRNRWVLDYFIVSEFVDNRIEKVEVVEEYGSKLYKPVR